MRLSNGQIVADSPGTAQGPRILPAISPGRPAIKIRDGQLVAELLDTDQSPQILQGPRGLAGDTGAQGPAGPVGPTGPIGPVGPAGAASTVAGPTGRTGETGRDGLTGPAGPAGPQGITGLQGPVGTDLHYTHTQYEPASAWVIDHPLGKNPSVVVIDSAGDECEGAVAYAGPGRIVIYFSAAFGGQAFLN